MAQVTLRPGTATAFFTLRDPAADMSLSVSCSKNTLTGLAQPLREGDRVVVYGKFEYYPARGSLSLPGHRTAPGRSRRAAGPAAADPRTAGRRRTHLRPAQEAVAVPADGGRADHRAGERRRVRCARQRPGPLAGRPVPGGERRRSRGSTRSPQMMQALSRLDADPDVQVIVLARGGGSVEDLLPFSDETLCRAVAACRTPVVSAIGHEPDHPIVDDVADVRCSTPTDAGKRVVPDAVAEQRIVDQLHGRARRSLRNWVAHEQARLDGIRSRAALADPHTPILARAQDLARAQARARDLVVRRLDREDAAVAHRRSQLLRPRPGSHPGSRLCRRPGRRHHPAGRRPGARRHRPADPARPRCRPRHQRRARVTDR